jgi:hypothetical protein
VTDKPNARFRVTPEFTRQVAAGMRAAKVVPGHVLLEGGPLADWLVKDGAPALDPGWSEEGQYVREGDRATWRPVTSS